MSNNYGKYKNHHREHGHNVKTIKPSVKQYVVIPAYTGNDKVICVEDGRAHYTIMNDYETHGYTNRLEEEGYTKAAYVPALEQEVAVLEKKLEWAKKELEEAKKHPLIISDEDARKLGLVKDEDFGLNFDE